MNNRNYMIFEMSEIDKIDFTQLIDDTRNTLRISVDKTMSIVKWEGSIIPTSINLLITKIGPYNQAEILDIIATPFWTYYGILNGGM